MRKLLKIFLYSLTLLALFLLLAYAYVQWGLAPPLPQVADKTVLNLQRETITENFYRLKNNWLRKTSTGLWEMYIEGEPFERGVISGKLEKELLFTQEDAFVEQIHRLVPDNRYLKILGWFTRVFNRHLSEHVPIENKLEIYGESFSAPKEFDFINPAYDRMLNYHAAHDIGHALQSLALVGCSSFAAWGDRSTDSTLLIGRNLDFYMGDKFARDKIVYFCSPSQGNKFAMITWAGFVGCVSGMNDKGLTVTINAAKSDVPTEAKTPISILAREILQYANNIAEAYAIAKKRETFVCETLMIGSAEDKKTALIEKSISKTILFSPDTNLLLCTNHYQSDSFKFDKNNIENIRTSASMYRYNRLTELLQQNPHLSYTQAAAILRDQKGLHGKNIGMGNEKALNQLIAHHAIIFQPEKLKFWVSANPYQMGEFVCYDLHKVFTLAPGLSNNRQLNDTAFTIPTDSFLLSKDWKNFQRWRSIKEQLHLATHNSLRLKTDVGLVEEFVAANPEFWETYNTLANYYIATGDKEKAKNNFELALTKEINSTIEADKIRETLKQLK